MKTEILRNFTCFAVCAALLAAPANGQTISAEESAAPYATARGWSVYTMADGRGIFSCRAVRGQGYNDQIMIEYDGFDETWRVLVQGVRPSGGGAGIKGAVVYYDGRSQDRQVGFGIPDYDGSSNSHAMMNLTEFDLDRVMRGSTMRLDINGERSRTWSLSGTTAAVLKVSECAQNFGFAPAGMAAAPENQPTLPNPTAAVDGYSVGYVVHATGQFRHTGGINWVEEGNNGEVFYFTEYDRNSESVFLNDAARDLQIWIALSYFEISYTQNFNYNAWTPLYVIDCFDREASRAC